MFHFMIQSINSVFTLMKSTIWNFLCGWIHVFYRSGPRIFGGHQGADIHDVCFHLLGIPSGTFFGNPEMIAICEREISKKVEGIAIAVSTSLAIIGIYYSWSITKYVWNEYKLLRHSQYEREERELTKLKRKEASQKGEITKQYNKMNERIAELCFTMMMTKSATMDDLKHAISSILTRDMPMYVEKNKSASICYTNTHYVKQEKCDVIVPKFVERKSDVLRSD